MASIYIPGFAEMINLIENAGIGIYETFGNLNDELVELDVDVPATSDYVAVVERLEDQLPGLKRRLALAEAIEAQVPGMFTVEIDESLVSQKTPEEAAEDAQRAADLMNQVAGSEEFSPDNEELTQLLAENANDPYFAHALAEAVSPEELSHYILAWSGDYYYEGFPEEMGRNYEAQLTALGQAFGLATRGTGDLRLPSAFTDEWMSALDPESSELAAPVPAALALVMSRGDFDTDFLTRSYDTVMAIEVKRGDDAFNAQAPVFAPGEAQGFAFTDPLAGITAALALNPEAAQTVFDPSRTASVEIDGETIELGDHLRYAFSRGWDEQTSGALAAALQAAATPYEGGSTVSLDIAEEISSLQEEAEQRESAGFWSGLGHFLLDLVGLVPGLGEWADGINAGWYTAEGNYVDAGLSAAGAVPIAGWFAVGGKWVRKIGNLTDLKKDFTAEEIAEIERALRNADNADFDGVPGRIIDYRGDSLFFRQGQVEHFHFFRGNVQHTQRQSEILAQGGYTEVRVPRYELGPDGMPIRDASGNPVLARGENGQIVYNRVDGYFPGSEIIELKPSLQLANASEARQALRQLAGKYGPGTEIPDIPSTREAGLAGGQLDGDLVLEVPVQNGPVPQSVLDEADRLNVTIRDAEGNVLN
ncbi:hypothetical protein GCM10022261_11160 [Brevibacterium daeguense]|uniref:Uncharacterized protein n=2 Tax=Brevibacterium daeguense TaxID=909936 RepID=A0ABP8EI13_9MICO